MSEFKWSMEECGEYALRCKAHAAELGGDYRFEKLYEYAQSLETKLNAYDVVAKGATVEGVMELISPLQSSMWTSEEYDAVKVAVTALVVRAETAERERDAAREAVRALYHTAIIYHDAENDVGWFECASCHRLARNDGQTLTHDPSCAVDDVLIDYDEAITAACGKYTMLRKESTDAG